MNEATAESWIYFKLYLGSKADRADNLLIDLCQRMMANTHLQRWFYLRFLDEQGFHIRLRALPNPGMAEAAQLSVNRDAASVLERLHSFLPSTYQTMVSLPEYTMDAATPDLNLRVLLESDEYQPEVDKYGSADAVAVAEQVFHGSSELAFHILEDEANGHYSRKTLAPWLMFEPQNIMPAKEFNDYWCQYSLYWLGGESPAADDWRQKFHRKAEDLKLQGFDVLAPEAELPSQAQAVLNRWRGVLGEAATAFAKVDSPVARPDVLSLNLSHLMMNRLGIATLEESYLAALLEAREVPA